MADRLNQYPMLPQNFNPAMLQQQHSQQAQQQSQGDSTPQLQGITKPEHNRMWQIMQQQVPRDPYRAQNGNEMAGSQVNQQVSFRTCKFFFCVLSAVNCQGIDNLSGISL